MPLRAAKKKKKVSGQVPGTQAFKDISPFRKRCSLADSKLSTFETMLILTQYFNKGIEQELELYW